MSKQTSVLGDSSVSAEMKRTLEKSEGQAKTPEAEVKKSAAAEPGVTDAPSVAPEMKKTQEQANALGKLKAKLSEVVTKKQASIDEAFARDLHQLVGIEAPAADDGWQRPNVKVAGQATDLIDDHFVDWMQHKADEDVVKTAASVEEVTKAVLKAGTTKKGAEKLGKHLTRAQIKGALKAALGLTALGGAAYGGHKLLKRYERGVMADEWGSKTAAVRENDENLDLAARIRKLAQSKCRDV